MPAVHTFVPVTVGITEGSVINITCDWDAWLACSEGTLIPP